MVFLFGFSFGIAVGTVSLIRNIHHLRALAIRNSLFTQTRLHEAIERLGFVQADPIRSPATAQDLILRQRVKNYRVGDLDKKYSSLNLEEDYLYAYGFLPEHNWQLLHPRKSDALSLVEKKVLSVVRKYGAMHPRELESHCGNERVINAWGGYSKATTYALEHLHRRGLLRVVRREKGIRIYEANTKVRTSLSPDERGVRLVKLVADIFAPAPLKNLQSLRFSKPESCNVRQVISELVACGDFKIVEVDSTKYVLPSHMKEANGDDLEPPRIVRFLAPFDPLVWDRNRFELFWNWCYRFEAYTPIAKRVRGYYSLPLLWRDDIIGWANVRNIDGQLDVETGFVGKQPRDPTFKSELAKEIERMKYFLRIRE